MATYNVIICDTTAPNQLRTTTCPSGQYGHVVTMKLPDPQSVYGLPDISAPDMALVMASVATVWATAWLIKRLMQMF